jgi:hypothetical protein
VARRSAARGARDLDRSRGRQDRDLDLPRQGYAVFLFSPHAHARIRSIAIEAAAGVPGVYAVLTGQDWAQDGLGTIDPEVMPEDMGGLKGHRTRRPPLAIGRVRYVGERVAVIIAASEAQARDAAELVAVDYEPLPVVAVSLKKETPETPLVQEDIAGNVAVSVRLGNVEAVEPAFALAAHITHLSLVNNRITAVTMEPWLPYRARSRYWPLDPHHLDPARPRHPPCAGASDSARAGKPHPRLGGAALRPASQGSRPAARRPRRRRRPRSDHRTGRTRRSPRTAPHLALRWTGMRNVGAYIEGAGAIPLLSAEARLDRIRHPGW